MCVCVFALDRGFRNKYEINRGTPPSIRYDYILCKCEKVCVWFLVCSNGARKVINIIKHIRGKTRDPGLSHTHSQDLMAEKRSKELV